MKTKKRKTRAAKPRSTSKGLRVHKATETVQSDYYDATVQHPIFKNATAQLCSRLFDRAVKTIIEDADAIAGKLTEVRQDAMIEQFRKEYDIRPALLIGFELELAGDFVDYENKQQQAAITIWWPPVHCIRKVFPSYILRASLGEVMDLALAAKQTAARTEVAA